MNYDMQRPAWIIATALILSALIVLFAFNRASTRVSKALVEAGNRARSHVAVPSIPRPLKVELQDAPRRLDSQDRERFTKAFIEAVSGRRSIDGKTITEVVVTRTTAPIPATHLQLEGTLTCEGVGESVEFESYLHADGFGEFSGFVRTKSRDSQRVLLKDVRLRR